MEKHDLIRQYRKPHKVLITKEPSFHQIRNMVNNLRYRYGSASCIYFECWHFSTTVNPAKDYFKIFMASHSSNFSTHNWSELQDKYFELMGE